MAPPAGARMGAVAMVFVAAVTLVPSTGTLRLVGASMPRNADHAAATMSAPPHRTSSGTPVSGPGRTPLRVNMFSYIPTYNSSAGAAQFASLVSWIQAGFAKIRPDVDLVVQYNVTFNPYDTEQVAAAMRGSAAEAGAHVVELDNAMLAAVAATGVLGDAPGFAHECCEHPGSAACGGKSFYPMSCDAGTVNGTLLSTPTWLCSFYVHGAASGTCDFSTATSGPALRDALQRCKAPASSVGRLIGNFNDAPGWWTLPSVYVAAFVDTYGYAALDRAFDSSKIDDTVVDMIASLLSLCAPHASAGPDKLRGNDNPCLNGTFTDDPYATTAIVNDDAAASRTLGLIAYSEVRSVLLSIAGEGHADRFQRVAHVPFGAGHHPLFFQDGLVVGKTCAADAACSSAASDFIHFVSTSAVDAISLGLDQTAMPFPRYLLVSRPDFYASPRADAIYRSFAEWMPSSHTFPNDKLLSSKDALKDALCARLGC